MPLPSSMSVGQPDNQSSGPRLSRFAPANQSSPSQFARVKNQLQGFIMHKDPSVTINCHDAVLPYAHFQTAHNSNQGSQKENKTAASMSDGKPGELSKMSLT